MCFSTSSGCHKNKYILGLKIVETVDCYIYNWNVIFVLQLVLASSKKKLSEYSM